MSGLRVVKSVKRKKVKEIIHDANDVCKSAEIPSFLGSLEGDIIECSNDLFAMFPDDSEMELLQKLKYFLLDYEA